MFQRGSVKVTKRYIHIEQTTSHQENGWTSRGMRSVSQKYEAQLSLGILLGNATMKEQKMYGSKVHFVVLFFTTSSGKIRSGYTFRPIEL